MVLLEIKRSCLNRLTALKRMPLYMSNDLKKTSHNRKRKEKI